MKKWCFIFALLAGIGSFVPIRSHAQSQEAIQLILNYEKLMQLKNILKNMYDSYKVLSDGYSKVKDITSGNYKLHQVFLNGLMAVSPEVRNYRRVADIIRYQLMLVDEYKSAYNSFRAGRRFSASELNYLASVYKNLIDRSLENIDELTMVITASRLRMSDDERLQAIDRIFVDMEKKLVFLRSFNSQTGLMEAQRMREELETGTVKGLYNIR